MSLALITHGTCVYVLTLQVSLLSVSSVRSVSAELMFTGWMRKLNSVGETIEKGRTSALEEPAELIRTLWSWISRYLFILIISVAVTEFT